MASLKLYISGFKTSQMFYKLTSGLKAKGCDLIFHEEFIGYEEIFQEIETCDGLVAIIDGEFWASTWRAIETTFASGEGKGGIDRKLIAQPLPIFIMPVPYDFNISFYGRLRTAIILPPSPDDAVKTVIEHFT